MGKALRESSSRFLALVIAVSFTSPALRAEDVTWKGFFTTGLVFSDQSVPYNGTINKKPDIVRETVLGLNLSKVLSPHLEMAAQFLARESNADSALKADWAFVTYRPIESFKLTIGKQKLPMWMVSSYLDVGALYPWAHPPEEVYLLFPLKAFSGASAQYSLDLGPTALAVQTYGGETLTEVAPSAPTADSKVKASNMFGAAIEWTWDKTVARAAYNRATWDLDIGNLISFGNRRFQLLSYGLRSEWQDFSLAGEYASTKDLDEQKYQDLSKKRLAEAIEAAARGEQEEASKLAMQSLIYSFRLGGSKAYYVTGGYQATDLLALYLTYANLKKTPIEGASEDQSSTALGINVEPDESAVLKFEAKRISVPDESRGLFKDPSLEERKGLNGTMIYSINYNLIF